jgi:hypothetical protein
MFSNPPQPPEKAKRPETPEMPVEFMMRNINSLLTKMFGVTLKDTEELKIIFGCAMSSGKDLPKLSSLYTTLKNFDSSTDNGFSEIWREIVNSQSDIFAELLIDWSSAQTNVELANLDVVLTLLNQAYFYSENSYARVRLRSSKIIHISSIKGSVQVLKQLEEENIVTSALDIIFDWSCFEQILLAGAILEGGTDESMEIYYKALNELRRLIMWKDGGTELDLRNLNIQHKIYHLHALIALKIDELKYPTTQTNVMKSKMQVFSDNGFVENTLRYLAEVFKGNIATIKKELELYRAGQQNDALTVSDSIISEEPEPLQTAQAESTIPVDVALDQVQYKGQRYELNKTLFANFDELWKYMEVKVPPKIVLRVIQICQEIDIHCGKSVNPFESFCALTRTNDSRDNAVLSRRLHPIGGNLYSFDLIGKWRLVIDMKSGKIISVTPHNYETVKRRYG